jgi:hypothetical protein
LDSFGCESKGGKCIDANGKAIVKSKDRKGRPIYEKDTASNVKVSFGGSRDGFTSIPDTKAKNIFVSFGTGYGSNPGIIGNEGANVAAIQDYLGKKLNGLKYQAEFDGAFVQAVYGEFDAIANGNSSYSFAVGPNGKEPYSINVWEKAWETPDHATVRANREKAINTFLREDEDYALTPGSRQRIINVTSGKRK